MPRLGHSPSSGSARAEPAGAGAHDFSGLRHGMGAGIIVHGKILRGASETAGELATLRVPAPGRCAGDGAAGWEESRPGRGLTSWRTSCSRNAGPPPPDIHTIVQAALANDPDAVEWSRSPRAGWDPGWRRWSISSIRRWWSLAHSVSSWATSFWGQPARPSADMPGPPQLRRARSFRPRSVSD